MKPQGPQGERLAAVPDRELVAGVRRREPAALERFFDFYYDRVFGHVVRMVGDPHQAEDVAHDIFLRLHRNLERLDPERDPTGWVFTVAANGVRDFWRSRVHHEQRRQAPLADEHLEVIPSQQDDPLEQLDRQQDADVVSQALAELSESDREIILLRDYENLDTATIAEVLELQPDAVRQRHSRAVARLGEAFRRILARANREP